MINFIILSVGFFRDRRWLFSETLSVFLSSVCLFHLSGVCVCVCVCVCAFVCVPVCWCVGGYLCPSVCVYACVFMFV